MPIPQLEPTFQHKKIDQKPSFFSKGLVGSGHRQSKAPKKGFFGRWFKKYWLHIVALILLLGIAFIALVAWYSKDLPDVNKLIDRSSPLSTKIYDSKGETLLYEVHGPEQRTLVTISELPDYIKQATIAIEDKDFYNHSGISIKGIIRGQIVPRLSGQRAQGGSTLTQQFVKNAILTNERRVSRKIKEWVLSYRIEQKFTKDEILQMYLNEIPYGGSAYGIESAAHYYFDKSAKDLTLGEAAVLAALPQSPTYLSPFGNNKDKLITRQHTVLNLMVDQGYITKEKAEEAKQQELKFKKRAENMRAPHFVTYVKQQLEEEYGTTMVEQSGWKITTSLDWEMQQAAERAVAEVAPKNKEKYDADNAALVAIDVATGDIKAMVGSKDFFDDTIDGQVNVAIADRQPGSSIKPIVYLTAFIKGYRPDTILFDLATKFGIKADGTPYKPLDYDGKERGPVSIRQALAGSLNIPAVKVLYLAGVKSVTDLATQLGYTTLTNPDRYGLSLVLGGAEVKLLEHVNAYAAIAREGVAQDYRSVLKIEDSKGEIVKENKENKGRRVVDKKYTRILSDVMSDNSARAFIFGEANFLTLPDRPVAAKTGTTNDYHDAWTVGFTPDIAAGVWVGNSNNRAMKPGADGSIVAAPIWNKFMREVTAKMPVKGFEKEVLEPCDKTMLCGQLAKEQIVKIDKVTGKLATAYTPYDQIEEKKYLEVHEILQYVNINDPFGPPLDNPSNDPQYMAWEEPIKKWATDNGYNTDPVPTEFDDTHKPENQPSISILSPSENQTINSTSVNISVQVSAPLGVTKVEYFLDNDKVGESISAPFGLNYSINPFVSNGSHRLRAIASDDIGDYKEVSININIQLDPSLRQFNLQWVDPQNNANISATSLPYNLRVSLDKPQNIKKIDFYYKDQSNNSQWFAYIENPSNSPSTLWGKGLLPGTYRLYMVVQDQGNSLMTTPEISVNIQ
ncbi:MAG: penicillin-binding protein [Patescibacteria group bacterium]|jgi:1A family penicillin-binding protein